ncbi:glycosyltransferase family 2 protein [Staphylococcus pasteuri]|uniref:glycosyltransferase family 2 protein n=1 Tax=Staphylococcus pasteuri TaxID=45972 RepID=UPI001F1E7577|nr:glycosyltransferase family 2 protein [Staphylococcus pasteuri]
MRMIQYIITVFTTLSIVCGHFIYNHRYRLNHQKTNNSHDLKEINGSNPIITIIIPARNEAHRLPQLLESLLTQTGNFKVIVMDDGSTDDTVNVAKAYQVEVHQVQYSIEDKWRGKSRVCYEGMKYCNSKLVMFVDADVVFENNEVIEKLIHTYHHQDDKGLLSIQPYHKTRNTYESLSAIFNLMTVVGMNHFSSLKKQKDNNIAFGPILLTNIDDYLATNGHLNVEHSIIEGFAIGQAYQQLNLPVTLYEGKGNIHFRMYEEGLNALVKGWTKHLSVGANQTESRIIFAIMIWLFGSIMTSLGIIFSCIYKPISKFKMLTLYFIYTIQFIQLHRRVGNFSRILLCLHPLLFLFFCSIFGKSLWHTYILKKVEWKGRHFDIH